MKETDLVIVTNEPFPIGMAATNRIYSYAKELAKTKNVMVLVPQPTENYLKIENIEPTGTVDKINYEYTNRTTIWPANKGKLFKFMIVMIGLLALSVRIFMLRPKTIIVYTSKSHVRQLLSLLKHILKYRMIAEENEYPKNLTETQNKIKINSQLKYYKRCDGMMVMTNELKMYYEKLISKTIFHLPMTVNLDRFSCESILKNEIGYNYFIYVGGGGGFRRDGLINIVDAFNIFHKKHIDYKLLIVGPVDKHNSDFLKVELFVQQEKLNENIIFLGPKPSSEIPAYLANATGIVMAPQYNFESGGFPTKLGEFLASGKPLITTAVSEIPIYLNEFNSFIIPPGSNKLIALQMSRIIEDKALAERVGNAGRLTARLHFNVETYSPGLISFLKI
jgi:glycosyltransferase involved in cell wall biosynthesis